MGVLYLPCEIFHREFDAKLLLGLYLYKEYKHDSIIGYDKYFGEILKRTQPGVLLDKSCSSIMWKGRIKHAIARGSNAIISDEEGFIHINEDHAEGWLSRLDKQAALEISEYICWGSVDYNFYSSRVKQLEDKISIAGNCRSDLVSTLGKRFYKKTSDAMIEVYGKFYLCSDNFSVERRRKDYKHPTYNVSKEENKHIQKQYETTTKRNRLRRDRYAEILEKAVAKNPNINFIIRPHPVSDPRWWNERFWQYHNVHVVNIKNLEPWLLASEGIISMGCTSALQAQKANIDTINITTNDPNEKYHFNFPEEILGLKITSGDALADTIAMKNRKKDRITTLSSQNRLILDSIWKTSDKEPVSFEFARKINQLMPNSEAENFSKTANKILSLRKSLESVFPIDPDKWATPNIEEVKLKHERWANILGFSETKIDKLCNGLYCISKK